jgi:dTDP-glucose 4,6-dehydratase
MREKCVVIGSNSFSGAHFVDHLLSQEIETVGISRSHEPNSLFLPYKKRNSNLFKFHALDLNHDLDRIMEVIHKFEPDYVVNFAAQGMVAESWQHPEHWFQTNTVANVKFHDQLRKLKSLKKYVHVSTPEVYGSTQGTIQENTHYNPSTPYAVSRAAADLSLMSFFKAYQFPVVFTRAANVYGPGQQLYRIIPKALLCFLTGKKLQLHGGGHSTRSFIHINDVAVATLKIAREAPAGEIYHLSTPDKLTIRELVERLAQKLNVPFESGVEVIGERLGKDAYYLLDSAKARALGWKSQISFEQGLDETMDWVKNNLEELRKLPADYIHKP